MKKLFVWLFVAVMLFTGLAQAETALPSGLTAVEAEAFLNDASLTGTVVVPASVTRIGDNAFSGTGLFALDIAGGKVAVGSQTLKDAAYVRVRGMETTLASLTGVRCVIAPASSAAASWAQGQGLTFVAQEKLVSADGFLYRDDGDALTLLCAADAERVGQTVTIPAQVGGKQVKAVSGFAFLGCGSLREIRLPEAVRATVVNSAFSSCPNAAVSYYGSEDGLSVDSVTANVTTGDTGDAITWKVGVTSDSGVKSYLYTLSRSGEVIRTETSSSATFTCSADEPGAYQLTVVVTDKQGQTSKGVSAVLYIAMEAMQMTVPETLVNGADLSVVVNAVEGATSYGVHVTNEDTGESVTTRTLTKPGSITVNGYLLEAGRYRVSGYVYGNDFRYAVPTVRIVTVTGEKAAGPQLQEFEPRVFSYEGIEVKLDDVTNFTVRHWNVYADGTKSSTWTSTSSGGAVWLSLNGSYEEWSNGGVMYMQAAAKVDGVWSAWGEPVQIEVYGAPALDKPVVTAPATVQAGTDVVVTIGAVENATEYNLMVFEGYYPDEEQREGETLYWDSARSGGILTIPGYELSPGVYTIQMRVWAEEYESSYWNARLEVTGTRPAAPTVTANKTEVYVSDDSVTLTISAPGAEGALIERDAYSASGGTIGWGESTVSLDENGQGTHTHNLYNNDECVGYTLRYRVAAIIDGKWSDFAVVKLPMKARDPLAQPVVTAPATLTAGQDLNFVIAAVENADTYEASIRRSYDSGSFHSWNKSEALPGKTLTLPGYELTQGNYYLRVRAFSEEFGSSEVEIPLTITGTRPSAPAITADLAETHIRDTITFTVDTTGADKICIDYESTTCSWGGHYGSTVQRTASGDTTAWSYKLNEDAEGAVFTFRFSVLKDGVWSAWKTFEREVLSLPVLDTPTVDYKTVYEAGEDIVFTINPVENAEKYGYRLYLESGGNSGSSNAQPTTYSYNGYDYDVGTYRLEITASAAAYTSSVANYSFEIVGTKPAAPAVSVNMTEAGKNQKFTFDIDTTGAELIRYSNRYSFQSDGTSYGSSGNISVLEDQTKWTTSTSTAGRNTYSFSVFKDGKWSAWSEPIEVMIADSALPKPTFTVSSGVKAGQDLTVTVNAVEGASHGYVYLYNSRGSQICSSKYVEGTGSTVTFDGYFLPSGSYSVRVWMTGSVGSSEATSSVYVSSGTRPAAPAVEAETDLGRVSVYYSFTISTTGAEKAVVRYYREGNTNSVNYKQITPTDDSTVWKDYNSTAGEVWYYAFAVKQDGVWSGWSSTQKVTITSRAQLAKVTLNVPETVGAGEDVAVSFTGVSNADTYRMYIYRPDGSYDYWTSTPGVERVFSGHSLANGTYRIKVVASGAEYDDSTAEATFVISGVRSAAPQVSVDVKEVFTNEVYTFVIDTEGAERLMYRSGWTTSSNTSSGSINVLSDTTVWETSCSSSGVRSYEFSVFRDGKWSEWSNPVSITINARPVLPAPTFTLPETVQQGQNLTVAVDPVEGASYYYINVYDSRGNYISYASQSNAGTTTFLGYRLPVGKLRIDVEAYSSANGYSKSSGQTEVVSGVQPDAPVVTPPENTTVAAQEYYTFAIDTAGAERGVVRYYRIGAPNDLSYSTFSVSGQDTTSWRSYSYNGGNTYAYSFAVQIDGVWTQWSEFIEITVE